MQSQELLHTKKRLSAIFALVVFLISLTLATIFLSYKYISETRNEKLQYIVTSSQITEQINSVPNFLENFAERRNPMRNPQRNRNFSSEQNILYTNFIILDNSTNELLFWNINRDFDIDALVWKELKPGFFLENSIMTRTIALSSFNEGKSIVFFKELRYSFSEYAIDMFRFFIISLISSFIFYIIGLKFVAKNLKPVEENLKDMQNFIHNAGHELKTPLSVVHGNLQLLKEIKKYDADIASESIEEINKLNKLIEWLVDLSDIHISNARQTLILSEEIPPIIKDFSKKAEDKQVTIDIEVKNDVEIDANREYFYIVFSNILGNAIKYNNDRGNVKIILNKNYLSVIDSWIWIEKSKQTKVFDRFYKTNTVRNSEGYGIGLSLVKKITDMYKWKTELSSDENKWTNFTVKFR